MQYAILYNDRDSVGFIIISGIIISSKNSL